jgi:DNA polymerase-3 subunit gamma/tau
MEYTVLARRFRPQSFGEVVGQETIAQALRNAISSNRVAHAYLFTGARGVGKTSTARILAKSLNCPNATGGDPCNQCEVCHGISQGNDVDVIEIDGASNRGIDEIRTLRANVNIKPMRCRYKIYIIDEVHMLTKEAFNALLKTLEEPPSNVKFIFCTTDPQKVPETILSRCQRFDFGTIATATISQRLAEIAAAEGVAVEPKAVQLVARRAAGSMRDSQSLFDQLLAFGGKQISAADVHRLLGTAPDERLVDLGAALVDRDRVRVLELLEVAIDSGVQVSELTDQLLNYFRDLMVLAAGANDAALLSVDEDQRGALTKQAELAGLQTVLAALQILAESKNRMKGATFSRVLLELALIRIATLDQLDSLSSLIVGLRQAQGIAAIPSAPSVARMTVANRETDATASPEIQSSGTNIAQVRSSSGDNPARPPEENGSKAPTADANEAYETVPFELGREAQIWTQVLLLLSDMVKSKARNVARTAISGPNTLVLAFPRSYHFSKEYFERSPEHLGKVEKALERVVGNPVRVQLTIDEGAIETSPTPSAAEPMNRFKPSADAERDPLVQRAISVFGATVVRVEGGPTAANLEQGNKEPD